MCTSPILIKNHRKRFIEGIDKTFIKVPCGKCLECRNARRNEIYVLSLFEYLNATGKGGFTQFFTLTYDNDHLPTFAFKPCFSRKDIKDYFKRVTSACKRAFGKDFKFRRLVVCEYGDNTKRPHYHCLLFVQNKCNHFKFREILENCWSYGWSFGSWDNFGEVNRPNGIRYVTKYVCKDSFDTKEDEKWLDANKDISDRMGHLCRLSLPFTLHSKSYGFCAINHLFGLPSYIPEQYRTSLEDIIKYGRICVPVMDGVCKSIAIPRTLLRKIFYNITWRYRRVSKRFKHDCEVVGVDVPKHRVQSFYIPKKHLYYDYFRYKMARIADKVRQCDRSLHGVDTISDVSIVQFPRVFSSRLNSNLTFKDYVEQYCKIMCERDPIFGRDPFTKEFYFIRAPLERCDFPDLVSYLSNNYSSSDALSFFNNSLDFEINKSTFVEKYNAIEKIISDVKTLKNSLL